MTKFKFKISNFKKSRGQVLLAVVIFFLAFSLALLLGFAAPVLRSSTSAGDMRSSRQAFYASESLGSDIVYRYMTNKTTSTNESLAVGDATATSTVSNVLSTISITMTATDGSIKRAGKMTLALGDGVSFHYAVQSGDGGFLLTQSSSITGNVYSGGSIIGDGGNVIGGDVISSGVGGTVYGVHATGTVYAHLIGNASAPTVIDKDAYYSSSITNTTVSGSACPNSHCHSGSTDQPSASLPISDAQITVWENDAAAGGTLLSSQCDTFSSNICTITTNKTWGPLKVPFSLVVKGATLTVSGPLWVVGNITTQTNGTQIKMSPSLGSENVAIIADNSANQSGSGIISIQTGTTFAGSGSTGSFVFMISQNNSAETGGSTDALAMSQSSTALVAYAAHGQMTFSQSASVKSATAYKIILANSANITYDTGLPSTVFQSGPSGGYSITGWSEQLP